MYPHVKREAAVCTYWAQRAGADTGFIPGEGAQWRTVASLLLNSVSSGADPGFLLGEGAKGLMTLYGMGRSDFWHTKHRFATFQDLYCRIVLEWCWTTIQETPVSLLSALETKEPAPSARVPPSQGWAPDPSPPWIRAWSWMMKLRPRGGRLP